MDFNVKSVRQDYLRTNASKTAYIYTGNSGLHQPRCVLWRSETGSGIHPAGHFRYYQRLREDCLTEATTLHSELRGNRGDLQKTAKFVAPACLSPVKSTKANGKREESLCQQTDTAHSCTVALLFCTEAQRRCDGGVDTIV